MFEYERDPNMQSGQTIKGKAGRLESTPIQQSAVVQVGEEHTVTSCLGMWLLGQLKLAQRGN